MVIDKGDKHLVIGAGFVGLAMAKALKEAGIDYDQVDRDAGVGGNWRHGVYAHVHIISSKRTTEYSDFPMPEEYPDFPSARQILDYLLSYAKHFQLESAIEFNKAVDRAVPTPCQRWQVTFADGEQRLYKGILVCNGHHWDSDHPTWANEFSGTYLHSKRYQKPEQLAGKRILVVGGGNSACDVASDGARVAASVDLSLRRGVWFFPKTFIGIPTVEHIRPWVPVWAQRWLCRFLLKVSIGNYRQYGLPEPTDRIFDRHPTVTDTLLSSIKHGLIKPRPGIAKIEGDQVVFTDGSNSTYDMIVAATGYKLSFPFLPDGMVPVKDKVPQIPNGTFHPDYRGLYIVGWGQVRYGVGPLITAGAPILCDMIKVQEQMQVPLGAVLRRLGIRPPKSHVMDPMKLIKQSSRNRRRIRKLPYWEKVLARRKPFRMIDGDEIKRRFANI